MSARNVSDYWFVENKEDARKVLEEHLDGKEKWLRVFCFFLERFPADVEMTFHDDGVSFVFSPDGREPREFGYGYEDIDCILTANPVTEDIDFHGDEKYMKVMDYSTGSTRHLDLSELRDSHDAG